MQVGFIAIGFLMIIVAIKGNVSEVASQFGKDVTGKGGFLEWVGAILVFALIGRVANTPQAAKLFIALLIVVYLIHTANVLPNALKAVRDLKSAQASTTGAVGANVNILDQPQPVGGSPAPGSGGPSSSWSNSVIPPGMPSLRNLR